jgi:hypothetical protein
MTNLQKIRLAKILDYVPASNIWNILRLANEIRKFARLLQCSFLSEILNCLLEFIRKHRPHRPNCPSEGYI